MKHNQEKPHHYPIKPKKMKSENISFGAIKTGIFLLLILIQMVLLVLSYLTIFAGFKSFLTISLIISVSTCIYILSSNKNSHSKAVWILSLWWIIHLATFFTSHLMKKYFSEILKKDIAKFINQQKNTIHPKMQPIIK